MRFFIREALEDFSFFSTVQHHAALIHGTSKDFFSYFLLPSNSVVLSNDAQLFIPISVKCL